MAALFGFVVLFLGLKLQVLHFEVFTPLYIFLQVSECNNISSVVVRPLLAGKSTTGMYSQSE